MIRDELIVNVIEVASGRDVFTRFERLAAFRNLITAPYCIFGLAGIALGSTI